MTLTISKALRSVCYISAAASILYFLNPLIGIARGTADSGDAIGSWVVSIFFGFVAGVSCALSRLKLESRAYSGAAVVRGILWCVGFVAGALSLRMLLFLFWL